ncbi:MAG: helix-turn-helix domain-containing protein [Myxococcota bacterium]|nr:helix-turn-helix domain-containing protein [Myxococcota bacterium]
MSVQMMPERRGYLREEELVARLMETIPARWPHVGPARSAVLMREVDCYRGRADVVRAAFSVSRCPANADKVAELLVQPSAARILARLHRRAPRSETFLEEATGLSRPVLRQRIRQLVESGLVRTTSRGSLLRRARGTMPEPEIWSFEAKLSKWRRALYQAMQYRGFSHRSIVVMPPSGASAALANVERFRRLGVGLVVLDEAGCRVVHWPPKTPPFSRALFQIAIGRALGALCSAGARTHTPAATRNSLTASSHCSRWPASHPVSKVAPAFSSRA